MSQGFINPTNIPIPVPITEGGTGSATGSMANLTGLTNAQLPAANYAQSSSCGVYTNSTATPTAVTNLSVNLTTAGRPVFVTLIPDETANYSFLQTPLADILYMFFYNGTTLIAQTKITTPGGANALAIPPGSFIGFDTSGAGTYTYSVKACSASAGAISIQYCKLLVWEI